MSVLIEGMEMPKDGVYWCEIGVAGDIATITIHGEDRKSFHLIELPDHGDLIDRDAIYVRTMDYWDLRDAMDDAPVVIPAERSEE